MRYDGQLLTEAESVSLIDEVDRWCRRTGTNYNKLVVVARVAPCTRRKISVLGKRVSIETADRLRKVMLAYPQGISRDEYRGKPKPWSRASITPPKPEPVRVSSAICGRCGAREGRCDHTRFESVWSPRMVMG